MHGVLLMPSFKKQRELIQGPNNTIAHENYIVLYYIVEQCRKQLCGQNKVTYFFARYYIQVYSIGYIKRHREVAKTNINNYLLYDK